jgi:hypothetical protein
MVGAPPAASWLIADTLPSRAATCNGGISSGSGRDGWLALVPIWWGGGARAGGGGGLARETGVAPRAAGAPPPPAPPPPPGA